MWPEGGKVADPFRFASPHTGPFIPINHSSQLPKVMNVKTRLTLMNFMQYFTWGSWLISLGGYMMHTLHFTGGEVGSIFATLGIACLFMPAIVGIIADRWMNAERLYGLMHIIGGVLLFIASTVKDPTVMYWIMLLNAMVYMPTIALSNSIAFSVLEQGGYNVVKSFPPIRVWGTIGFICAMWTIDLLGLTVSPAQLYISSGVAFLLGLYSFTLPACPPARSPNKGNWVSALGLDAFVLFKRRRMAIFFVFSAFLAMALQITNTFGEAFLHDFDKIDAFKETFGVKHPGLLMSVSQISETLFILTIPFFLRRFGIKVVMMLSILAWIFRFGLFGLGDPGDGLWMLVLSMVIYGMAFDFFNISGFLYVEMESETRIRASAQGVFMIMTNGVGAFIGGTASGWVVDYFTTDGIRDWSSIWFTFAAYAVVLALVFPFVFKYKHDPKLIENFHH